MQALYAMDLAGRWAEDPNDFFFEKLKWPDSVPFAERVLEGVLAQRETLDKNIQEHTNDWSVSRMNCIDRNILRIAAYEILCCDDIPEKVSINEALELAKVYGAPESKRFLNGILDKIARPGPSLP